MKIRTEKPVHLDGRDLKKGTHTVADYVAETWFFKALVKDGRASVLIAPEEAKQVQDEDLEKRPEAVQPVKESVKKNSKKKG